MTLTATACLGQSFTLSDQALLGQGQVVNTVVSNAQVLGAIAWYKGSVGVFRDYGTNSATNTQQIFQWNDQSGFSNNLVTVDTNLNPILITNGINGFPVVRFIDNPDTTFLIASNLTNQQLVIAMMVMEYDDHTAGGGGFEMFNSAFGSFILDEDAFNRIALDSGTTLVSPIPLPGSVYNYITLVFNGISSSIRQNGVTVNTGNVPNGISTTAFYLESCQSYNRSFAEVILSTNLATIPLTEAYFTNKYNIH